MAIAITNPSIPAMPSHLSGHRFLRIGFIAELTNQDGYRMDHHASFLVDREDFEAWPMDAERALDGLCYGRIKHAKLMRWMDWAKA